MSNSPRIARERSLALALLLIPLFVSLVLAAPASARDHTPAPPGGGPGVTVLPADQADPGDLPAPGPFRPDRAFAEQLRRPVAAKDGDRYDDLGGDDVAIVTHPTGFEHDLAVAANGDLFAVTQWGVDEYDDYKFAIFRSDDGGTTWRVWAQFVPTEPSMRYWDPVIHVAEGDDDRVFLVYVLDPGDFVNYEVHVAWSPLEAAVGDFSNDVTVFTAPLDYVFNPCFTTDAATWDDYYCYLAFSADDGDGDDVYFVRSTTMGSTWETPYVIGAISVGDRGYYRPQVAVGYGGWVHVAWYLGFDVEHELDNTIRYRRVPNYAAGGLANWENTQSITPHTDDVDVLTTHIAASLVTPDVMMAFQRRVRTGGDTFLWDGIMTLASSDAGGTWSSPVDVGDGYNHLAELFHQEATDRWLLGVNVTNGWEFRQTPVAAPGDWSSPECFSDEVRVCGGPELIVDPSHDGRIGIMGGGRNSDGSFTFYFDAEWRSDPGYPNLEAGFPVELNATPISDPAVVDLDGDGTLEIVFTDEADKIQVYQADGTPLPGWPVQVSTALSDTPVAIGDLNGDGEMAVVIGTTGGLVAAYDATGALMAGWPVSVGVNAPVYLAIGSVGGPYPRAVVAGAGGALKFFDRRGRRYPGSIDRVMTGRVIDTPPAVGDIDGDGRNEVVVAASHSVYAFPMDDHGWDINLDLEADVSGGVALADFDLDGDVEVVAPLANGVVHLLQGDGSEYPGAWPVTAADSELNGAAIAHFLGETEPEIALTARDWLVTVVRDDGGIGAGWPESTDGWRVYGKPVIGRVEAAASDVIVGARGRKGWAWSGLSGLIPGWPKALDDHVYQTPAYGDLDLDGNAEIVFLTGAQLVVVDIAVSPTGSYATWAMAGHDAERTGCWQCADDVVAVDDAPAGVTRVSMAAPWPNPIAGQATFAYSVPVRARVELAIYDVRGRRVATVHRAEEPAGQHLIGWDGRDDAGRSVASGQYVAALKVTGPRVDETVSRKVTVLR